MNPLKVAFGHRITGRARLSVVDAATGRTVREFPWQRNLILNQGLDYIGTIPAADCMAYCVAGTGNTPTKDLPDGFFSQSGTTVTRESGTRDFIAGDVGKLIRFSDGTKRTITALIGVTSVTVGVSGAVPLVPGSVAITAATSNPTDFTITAAGHGREVGDRITIAGVTPSGYNGNWTIASKTSTTITVTSGADPGVGTIFGTVALAALSAIIYRVNQTGLATEVKRSNSYPQFNWEDGNPSQWTDWDFDLATTILRRTYDFTEEVGNTNYTEIGFAPVATVASNLFSRILLAGAVTVLTGQLLRVKYELTLAADEALAADVSTVDGGITGWPRPYDIASITASGSAWTMTLTETHHFVAGGKINIDGALRPKIDITVATSNPTDFTITAPGHGRSPGDSIVIEGMTPSGYNGTHTIAAVSGDDIEVTSALNPGPGTVFGTVRQATPSPWYDGEHTIASVTSTTVVITSALSIAAAGASGTAYNNTKRKMRTLHMGWGQVVNSVGSYGNNATANMTVNAGMSGNVGFTPLLCGCFETLESAIGSSFHRGGWIAQMELVTVTNPPTGHPRAWNGSNALSPGNLSNESGLSTLGSAPTVLNTGNIANAIEDIYVSGTYQASTTLVWGAGAGNRNDIRLISLYACAAFVENLLSVTYRPSTPSAYILFEERQLKESTHKLSLQIVRAWDRDLTVEAS